MCSSDLLNGANGKALENFVRRNELLRTQVKTLRADNIGDDVAETYNKFSELTNNYNAILSSTSKVNQMSLVNFL